MSTAVNIEFDENSLKILKDVDSIHRHSLVNLGLAMIAKTPYYKTLTGDISSDVLNTVTLNELDTVNTNVGTTDNMGTPTLTKSPKKPAISWDNL